MPYPTFNRMNLDIKPLSERQSDMTLDDLIFPSSDVPPLDAQQTDALLDIANRIEEARRRGAEVIISYGAHLIKNGLGPVLNALVERDDVTLLVTNGAGTIHDWELAYLGRTTESVERYTREGQFGIWDETGRFINMAIALGAAQGLGYGESLGKMIHEDRLYVPGQDELIKLIAEGVEKGDPNLGARADLLQYIREFNLPTGEIAIEHPHKQHSVLRTAYAHGVPLCVLPGIGYDIIYSHYLNRGAAIGKTAVRDFLTLADAQLRLQGGIYISIGSAIMSPMTFEKTRAMARNIARQRGQDLDDVMLIVNDIQPVGDDWRTEPGKSSPAYYLRFLKTFRRMMGDFRYVEMDNRAFLLNLLDMRNRGA